MIINYGGFKGPSGSRGIGGLGISGPNGSNHSQYPSHLPIPFIFPMMPWVLDEGYTLKIRFFY